MIKQLPKMINRISDLSRNKEGFGKVKSDYESALKDSGHFSSLSYDNSNTLKNLGEIKTGSLYGSTHHKAKMWKQILVNFSSSLRGNTSPGIANTIKFSA